MSFTPSKYQEDIYNFITKGIGNCVISARAGSGKTTTIVNAIKLVPETDKSLFIAFNKSIVGELQERLKEQSNVTVSTFHSLGYSLLRSKLKGSKLQMDNFKYAKFIKSNIIELYPSISDFDPSKAYNIVNAIIRLVDLARFYLAQTVKDLRFILLEYKLRKFTDEELRVVLKVLEWGKENLDTIDYTDMIWLPNELNLYSYYNYKWIFADECQDFSFASIGLVDRFLGRGGRCIFVGDPKQSIYAFAGSTPKAFERLCKRRNTIVKTLPISYRCSRKVVDLAKTIVDDIEPRGNAPEGNVSYITSLSGIGDNDMILSRKKAPLIQCFNELVKLGIKGYFNGNDLGIMLSNFVETLKHKNLSCELTKDSLIGKMYLRLFAIRDKLIELEDLDYEDATVHEDVLEIYDYIQCFEAILSNHSFKDNDELIVWLNEVFDSEKKGVCLSTIHKAKGLESQNVYIYNVGTLREEARSDEQEENLLYVAYTRAKENIYFLMKSGLNEEKGEFTSNSSIIKKIKEVEVEMKGSIKNKSKEAKNRLELNLNKEKARETPITYTSNVKTSSRKWGRKG